jgi:outer membrane receptor protein involved in Fe transport
MRRQDDLGLSGQTTRTTRTSLLFLPHTLFVFVLALTFHASGASAQTVGKVQGTVTDRETGQPLPGAQLLIEGTRLGNLTDDSGYYFINNVPVGAQMIAASLLGYQAESHERVVLAGQTTTDDFALTTEVIVADSVLVTLTEIEPLVPRDNTISKSRFIESEVRDLPLTSLDDLVTLAAGASLQQGGISLRGARPDDATVYVDGLNATDFSNVSSSFDALDAGGEKSPLALGQFSIEQLDVITGGADASFGDLQSGAINIVTGRGGLSLSGVLRFTTDAMDIERTNDSYTLQGSVGGPLLPDGKASFFVAGELLGTRATSDNFGFDARFEDVVAVGSRFGLDISREQFCEGTTCIPVRGGPLLPDRDPLPLLDIEHFARDYLKKNCTGTTCPADFLSENEFLFDDANSDLASGAFDDQYSFTGKVAFTPSARTDIQLSYSRSHRQDHSGEVFNGLAVPIEKETVDFAIASWRQVFHQAEDRSLAIEARVGYFDDRFKDGQPFDLMDQAHAFPLLDGNRGGSDFLNFRLSDYELFFEDSVQTLIDGYRGTNSWEDLETIRMAIVDQDIPRRPIMRGGGPDIFGIGQFRFPTPTAGFPRGNRATDAFVVDNREQRWNPRADLDAQLSRIDRLQAGVDLNFLDVHKLDSSLCCGGEFTTYFVQPRLFGFYATNRIDLGDFVLDLGGRLDYYDHNTDLPEVPGLARVDEDGNGSTLTRYDSKLAFGPRLGVAHPVTEKTQVRFSYGVFNQLPGLDELYRRVTSDLNAFDFGGGIIGNPDLDFQQTRSFELGLTHLLTENVVLDLVAYYRDIEDGTAARFFVLPQEVEINKLFNVNSGNVQGLDFTLSKRFSGYWSADVTYSYLNSKMTDSDQASFFNNRGFIATRENPVPPPQLPLTADFDLTHKLAATFSLRLPRDFRSGTLLGDVLQDFGFFATARFNSGLPFTRTAPPSGRPSLELPNSSRRSSAFRADARATKYFPIGSKLEVGAIFEVFNLLNNENVVDVHGTTGTRLVSGSEVVDAQTQVSGSDIVLAEIDTTTVDGALTREFRSFSDIDGDGILSREEQRIMGILAFGAASELAAEPKRHYRLGLELRF